MDGLRERIAWNALDYEIPPAANRIPYMLGGLTFFGIILLFATGLFLAQFYDPSTLGAHDSTVYIVTRVTLGYWIRGLHYWASAVVLVSVSAHVVWVFKRRSYRRPRELTWWSGVAMLALLFALVFTGTVLRSDQEGGEALAHAVAGAELVGPMGAPLTPGFAPSTTLLSRLYHTHVSLLPLALLGLMGLHFWLIRYLGIHSQEPRTRRFPQHLLRLSGLGLVVYAGIAALAALFPPGIGFPAVEGVEVTKPYWPFLWIYSAENAMGLWGMILAPAVLFAFLAAAPLLDRGAERPRWLSIVAVILLAAVLGALAYGAFAPKVEHLGM